VTYSENPGEGKIMMLASGNKIGIYLRF
jgi:hypothetical protein